MKSTFHPPGLPLILLKTLGKKDIKMNLLGDIEEEFLEIAEELGPRSAKRWFWRQFFRSLPSLVKNNIQWRCDVFRNYMLVALRSMKRQKGSAAINLLGLTFALACVFWIFLFIKHELSYNKFHKEADHLYSVIDKDHYYQYNYRATPTAVGAALKEYFPEIERTCRVSWRPAVAAAGEQMFKERVHFVDPDFLSMFSFPFSEGGGENALGSPGSILLTESMSRKYFGPQNPVGRTLTLDIGQGQMDFQVSGVLEDVPDNSTLRFDFLIDIQVMGRLRGPEVLNSYTWPRTQTYIELRSGASAAGIEDRMTGFVDHYFKEVAESRRNAGTWTDGSRTIQFWLQNIKDIHLHSQHIAPAESGSLSKLTILGGIGFLILLIACINFTNIAVGRSSVRAREIGMRKIIGASRRNLLHQVFTESTLTVAIAAAAGLGFILLFLPQYNHLSGKEMSLAEVLDPVHLLVLIPFIGLVGFLAGLYPGLLITRVDPVCMFRGGHRIGGRNRLTKFLVVLQYSASIFLVISTLVMAKQLRFINARDLGFIKEGVVFIDILETDSAVSNSILTVFKDKTTALPAVNSVSACVFPLGTAVGEGMMRHEGKQIHFLFSNVAPGYFETMGMTFLAGGGFTESMPSDPQPIVVNQQFVNAFELTDPVGQILGSGENEIRIVGVIEDFHYRSLKYKMEPVIHLPLGQGGPRNILVNLSTTNMRESIAALRGIWRSVQPNKPFVYSFLDDALRGQYEDDRRYNALVFYTTIVALLITGMGLVGMTLIVISRRIKEIGIRKVLGAPVGSIFNLLTGEFLLLLGVSNFVAWPVGYMLSKKWLEGYAYRTSIDPGIFLLAGVISLGLSAATIGVLTLRAAATDPLKSLRYE
jgi:putative ABC transport system permease protein